jgi:two-component system chemotaxis response regulator CheY
MTKVLIVDDAIFMRMSIRKMLENNGFDIVGDAENGKEAIIKERQLKPDLITMDITMPELDGISAVREIMKNNASAKICMVSAMGQERMIREAIELGAMGFLIKPFKEEIVVKTLNGIMKS